VPDPPLEAPVGSSPDAVLSFPASEGTSVTSRYKIHRHACTVRVRGDSIRPCTT
jgi:hypothetical protein